MSLLLLLIACVAFTVNAYPDGTTIQIYTCDPNSDRQKWTYNSNDLTLRLRTDNKCIDINGYGTDNGSPLWLYSCHTDDKDPGHQNQEFKFNSDGTFRSTMSGRCLDVDAYGNSSGTIVQIWDCTGADNQKWVLDTNTGMIKGVMSGLCLDAGSPIPRPCDGAINKNLPFCNIKLSFEQRVADLLTRISQAEKLGLFGNAARSVPSLNISSYQWWSEALHGVAGSPGVRFTGTTPVATSFPQIFGLGASFDMPLVHQVGDTVSTEARGFNHEGNAGLTFWAPNVNLVRDPRWGRGQETPGEDPYLASEYAMNFVSGMQGDGGHYLKVSSCCKHYTAYDLENWHGVDRHHFNAIVNERDMADSIMPAFKSCVENGKASSLMCSYNEVNGIPSCANKGIMHDTARGQWGFQGYITSDCDAVDDVLNTHHYTTSTDATCKAVLEAGMDLDCGGFLTSNLPKAVQSGAVTTADLDSALTNLFLVQFRLGFFDPDSVQPYRQLTASNVNTPDHQALALKAARESLVLLKNDGALPFDKSKYPNIALIGPNALASSTMQGNYYGNAPYLVTPQQGLNKYVKTTYAKGCDINSGDQSGFTAACSAAQSADATVLVIGLDQSQESEGHDRDAIGLPGQQNALIERIATCSKGPIVVVVLAGSSLDLTVPKDSAKVSAIIWAGYPGQSGGDAIAQTIFGDNNPAGLLPITLYPAGYVDQVSMFDMGFRPNTTSGNPGRTYRFYTGTPVYPFGAGLSYTKFSFAWSGSSDPIVIARDVLEQNLGEDIYSPWKSKTFADVSVTVTNTGNKTGDVVVLAFMKPADAGKDGNPIQYLFGFTRLHDLAPGAKQTVSFPTTAHDLSLVNANGKRVAVSGTWTVRIGDIEREIIVQ